jgi:outer membrane protein assembly factor BamB
VPVDESLYWCRPQSKPLPQLEKGPAFADEITAAEARDGWPCFRHDPARSAVTQAQLAWPVSRRWQAKLPGKLTPPIVAGGSVFISSDNHSVYALDAATGATRWRFVTGGEVWASPAWWQGRLYVGSQDGWAYCLRADTGRLVWRFRGAPHDRKMLYYGRPQSLWPIAGGVVVEHGTVQFYAGRCGHDRVFVWSLDARTGEVLWQNDRAGRAVEVTGPGGGLSPHGVSPSGVLAASPELLYVPQGPYAPAAFARDDGRILWWGRRGDSTQRSNIEVQNLGGPNLVVAEDLLFVGGPNAVTGSSQSFVALDARTGRMWGADDPRLFAKAGRDETGKAVQVKRAVFGTKPIQFGREFTPVVVDGGVFLPGYRGVLLDLREYLETQFGVAARDARKWSAPLPSGTLMVAGDKVLIASAGRLTALARSDGNTLGHLELPTDAAPVRDGVVVAQSSIFLVTTAGEVVSLGAP